MKDGSTTLHLNYTGPLIPLVNLSNLFSTGGTIKTTKVDLLFPDSMPPEYLNG